MSIWIILGLLFSGTVALMFLLWLWHIRVGNPAFVDVAWVFATGISGIVLSLQADGEWKRRLIAALLAGIWSMRLGGYLTIRLMHNPVDQRYESMVSNWGKRAKLFMFGFFMIQAFLAVIYSLPILAGASGGDPFTVSGILGVMVILGGMVGVSLSDIQLLTFKKNSDHTGSVCRLGLWSWSRHPNYFFEWIIWCGWALFSLGGCLLFFGVGGAFCMLLFLLKITGIPHVEREAIKKYGNIYQDYQKTTSMFIPIPPRKKY